MEVYFIIKKMACIPGNFITLSEHPLLKTLITEKLVTAAKITLDTLKNDEGQVVFDIEIYDSVHRDIGNVEITEKEIVWNI